MTKINKYMTIGIGVLTVALLTNVAASERKSQPQITNVSAITQVPEAKDFRTVYPDRVVELFTSQGCSSCPPANKFASELAQRDETSLVLSYGVTYWDYLGWEDTFADQSFTARQREYMKALKTPNIYTPQMIVNGTDHSPRYKDAEVRVKNFSAERGKPTLSFSPDGDLIIKSDVPAGHVLSVVRFTPGLKSVDVKAGENTGRTLELENVVEQVLIAEWDGKEAVIGAELQDGQAYAALFQVPETLEVLTAAVLEQE